MENQHLDIEMEIDADFIGQSNIKNLTINSLNQYEDDLLL
jgi:hypothetical protein